VNGDQKVPCSFVIEGCDSAEELGSGYASITQSKPLKFCLNLPMAIKVTALILSYRELHDG
jgi:hypothetical protein